MELSKQEYAYLIKKASPASNYPVTLFCAFSIGGIICIIGQILIDAYLMLGVEETFSPVAASCTLIVFASVLTGLNVFDDIAKVAGAGTLVPITGFANAVSAPSLEFKTEGMILGVGAKMFLIAGPVIVYGIVASSVYGLAVWFLKLY